jgi:hypothetical protein
MAKGSPSPLAGLAALAQLLDGRRRICTQLERVLDNLERTGLVVRGERSLLAALQHQLDRGLDVLTALRDSANVKQARQLLAELEALLNGTPWRFAAEQTLPDLQAKEKTRSDLLGAYTRTARQWRGRIEALNKELGRARAVGAPVGGQANELRRLADLVAQAERALDDLSLYGLPDDLMEELSAADAGFTRLKEGVQSAAQEAEPFSRLAEILILRSPLDSNAHYHYQVLLRTPSEPGAQGLFIQGESTLDADDRCWMGENLNLATDAINRGLQRRFQRGAAGAPAAPPGPSRDLRPLGTDPPERTHGDIIGALGDRIHRQFMPEEMKNYLVTTPCAVTITTNDLRLPWELMSYKITEEKTQKEKDTFLCLEKPVARMPLGFAFPRKTRFTPRVGKVRFLLIHADPKQTLSSARQEIQTIKEALEVARKEQLQAGQLEITVLDQANASGRPFTEALRSGDYDVIHYAGHANFDSASPELSGLLLHGNGPAAGGAPGRPGLCPRCGEQAHGGGTAPAQVFFAQKIRRLTEGRPLVFLNACESGCTANDNDPQQVSYLQERAAGLADAFIYGGARGCIGSLWPIYDNAAAQFAVAFYKRVLVGQAIGEAMRLARCEIKQQFPDQITWAAFVLYGDPTFRLASMSS